MVDDIEVDPVRPAFVAPRARRGAHVEVPAGTVTAVAHAARARLDGEVIIDLTIHFGIFEKGDPVEPGDRCRIWGEEQRIDISAESGFDSFLSTVAVASNVACAVVAAPPGLHTMGELSALDLASKGARRTTTTGPVSA
jgi:4-hydroxy-tetrahydrodipicolinate reductase